MRVALLAILGIALSVRMAYIVSAGHNAYAQSRDGEIAHNIVKYGRWFVYNERTREFFDGERLGEYPFAPRADRKVNLEPDEVDFTALDATGRFYPEIGESVGSSAVLAGLWTVMDDERYLPLQVVQAIVDALAALLVYRVAMRLFDIRRAALIAATLYAFYPPIAWETTIPYNDIWAVDFTVMIVACYMEIVHSQHRWRWLVACGMCAGIGSYFRPNVLLVAPILAVATITATGWREAFRRAGTVTLIAALLMVPWTVRNYRDFHTFIPATSSFWENMEDGLRELPNNFVGYTNTGGTLRRVPADLRVESPAWDSYLKGWVVHALERHPLFYLEGLARRLVLASIWKHNTMWMRAGTISMAGYSGGFLAFAVDRPVDLVQDAMQPAVFVLAMLVLTLTARRWRWQHGILIAAAVSVLGPYVVIVLSDRYILPAEFVYLIWIGVGADLLIERVRSRWRSASPPAVDRLRPSTAAR